MSNQLKLFVSITNIKDAMSFLLNFDCHHRVMFPICS